MGCATSPRAPITRTSTAIPSVRPPIARERRARPDPWERPARAGRPAPRVRWARRGRRGPPALWGRLDRAERLARRATWARLDPWDRPARPGRPAPPEQPARRDDGTYRRPGGHWTDRSDRCHGRHGPDRRHRPERAPPAHRRPRIYRAPGPPPHS